MHRTPTLLDTIEDRAFALIQARLCKYQRLKRGRVAFQEFADWFSSFHNKGSFGVPNLFLPNQGSNERCA
jgi:hypothetical protein